MKVHAPAGEQRVDVLFWLHDGRLIWHDGHHRRGVKLPEVSIGRTNSKRGLGFVVSNGSQDTLFVLDRSQVENLHAFLGCQIGRLKPMAWPPDTLNMTKMISAATAQPKRTAKPKIKRALLKRIGK
jgi:hypothetical protein